jgi:hypothetical protein
VYGPVIQGKLVRLRPPHPGDAAAMATWFEDLEVTRFIKLRNPPSVEAEKERATRTWCSGLSKPKATLSAAQAS